MTADTRAVVERILSQTPWTAGAQLLDVHDAPNASQQLGVPTWLVAYRLPFETNDAGRAPLLGWVSQVEVDNDGADTITLDTPSAPVDRLQFLKPQLAELSIGELPALVADDRLTRPLVNFSRVVDVKLTRNGAAAHCRGHYVQYNLVSENGVVRYIR